MVISIIDKVYMAAMIDGEGCIFVSKRKSYPRPSYCAGVRVANCDLSMLISLSNVFGGHINLKGLVEGHRDSYSLSFTKKEETVQLLESVQPYLRIKKEQCEIALWFLSSVAEYGGKKITDEIQDLREYIYNEMRILNLTGNQLTI